MDAVHKKPQSVANRMLICMRYHSRYTARGRICFHRLGGVSIILDFCVDARNGRRLDLPFSGWQILPKLVSRAMRSSTLTLEKELQMSRFFAPVLVGIFFVIGCGGYSADEAKTKCDLERNAKTACFNDATYDQCLSCYESCGTDCAVAESCPAQYICSE